MNKQFNECLVNNQFKFPYTAFKETEEYNDDQLIYVLAVNAKFTPTEYRKYKEEFPQELYSLLYKPNQINSIEFANTKGKTIELYTKYTMIETISYTYISSDDTWILGVRFTYTDSPKQEE